MSVDTHRKKITRSISFGLAFACVSLLLSSIQPHFARAAHPSDDIAELSLEDLVERMDFRRAKRMYVYLREVSLDMTQQFEVPLER